MCRMLMEHAYEAIVDAGINPKQLRGTKMGVFVGACFSEAEKTWFYEKLHVIQNLSFIFYQRNIFNVIHVDFSKSYE